MTELKPDPEVLASKYLEHRVAPGVSPSTFTPSSPKPGRSDFAKGPNSVGIGKSDFNESKVKRDGRGRFANKEGRDLSPEDEEWAKDENIRSIAMDVSMKVLDSLGDDMIRDAQNQGYSTITKQSTVGELYDTGWKPSAELEAKSDRLVVAELSKPKYYSPSGTLKIEPKMDAAPGEKFYRIVPVARHSDVELDEGMSATAMLGSDFLEQHGIKGMHWGERRSREELAGRTASLKEKKSGLQAKQSKAVVKRDARLAKESEVQRSTLVRLAKGKKVGMYRRHKIRSVSRKAVRSLRQTNRIEKKIRRTDTKISKMEKATIEAGKQAAKEMLTDD